MGRSAAAVAVRNRTMPEHDALAWDSRPRAPTLGGIGRSQAAMRTVTAPIGFSIK
jgi:hypothetical protein